MRLPSSHKHSNMRACGLLAVVLAVLLSACGSGGGQPGSPSTDNPGNGGNAPPSTPGDVASEIDRAYAVIDAYGKTTSQAAVRGACAQDQEGRWCPPGARSGSPAGEAVHAWMAGELAALPAMRDVQTHPFAIPRFSPRDWGIRVAEGGGDFRPRSLPWHFTGRTPPDGILAPLVDVGADGLLEPIARPDVAGSIALVEGQRLLNAERPALVDRLASLRDAGAVGAIVHFPEGPANLIVAQNYDSRLGMMGLPTLIVGKKDGQQLRELEGRPVQLTLDAGYHSGQSEDAGNDSEGPAYSRNVSAWLPGFDSSRWLVIGTPMNSWLPATAERGPGLAVFLQLARRLNEQVARDGALPYPVYFVATGGHEIFQFGLQRFLSCWDSEAIGAYVHAGAGLISRGHDTDSDGEPVATEQGSPTRTLTISENLVLRNFAKPAFSHPALRPLWDFPPSLLRPGEARVAWESGIPTVAVAGSNVYHHTMGDDRSQILAAAMQPILDAHATVVDGLLASDLTAIQRAELGSELRQAPSAGLPCAGALAGLSNQR